MPDRKKPNLLLIMTDQHRFDYLGCAGAGFVRTPHIDRLAARGMRFTHCCTNAPICAPARISLATGLQPFRTGALRNEVYLPRNTPTYYQHLRDHGYQVGCVGKLDLGKPDPYNGVQGNRPMAFGWGFTHPEECEGKMHAGQSSTPFGPYSQYLHERGLLEKFHADYQKRGSESWMAGSTRDSILPAEHFEDAYIGRRAAEWIRKIPGDFPWHYFVSFVGPHDPYDPPTEYADRYRGVKMPDPILSDSKDKPAWVYKRDKKASLEDVQVARRQYCASIEIIDDHIGMILDSLEKRGWLENTYIIFTSDHGEMLGDHGLYTKHVAYEASLRVPLIAVGPGIEAGKTSNALVELMDVNPTLGELAGLPSQGGLDARSFAPVLRGMRVEHREDALSMEYNYRCLRTRQHKLIESSNDIMELYDLEKDPSELRNLAKEDPGMVKTLVKRLRERCQNG